MRPRTTARIRASAAAAATWGRRRRTEAEAGKEVVFEVVAQVAADVEIADMVCEVLTVIETKTGEDGDFAELMAETMADVIEEHFPDFEVEIDLSAMVVSSAVPSTARGYRWSRSRRTPASSLQTSTIPSRQRGGGGVAGVGKVVVGLVAVLVAATI